MSSGLQSSGEWRDPRAKAAVASSPMPNSGSLGQQVHFVRFILLTGARRAEAQRMVCAEINSGDWTLPASRNKTKVDLVRPLSKAALATRKEGFSCAPNGSKVSDNGKCFTDGQVWLFQKFK